MIQEIINTKLVVRLKPDYLQVLNESANHNVAPGSATHFKVTIVSPQFDGQQLLQRHRTVYKLLATELTAGVHAIALHTYTPKEWQSRQGQTPVSPVCHDGGTSS